MAFTKDDIFNKIKRLVTYCGEYLRCLDIKKGDSYDTVFKKVDATVCELFRRMDELDSPSIVDNPLCPNGGFVLLDGYGQAVYSSCYPEGSVTTVEDSTTCDGFDVFIDSIKVYTYCHEKFILSFVEESSCSNGGFTVKDVLGATIFSQCYPENYNPGQGSDIVNNSIDVLVDGLTIKIDNQNRLFCDIDLGLPSVLFNDNTTSGEDIKVSSGDVVRGINNNTLDLNYGPLHDNVKIESNDKLNIQAGIIRKTSYKTPGATINPDKNDYIIVLDNNTIALNSTREGEEFLFYNQGKGLSTIDSLAVGGIIVYDSLPNQTITIPPGGIMKIVRLGAHWVVIYKNF